MIWIGGILGFVLGAVIGAAVYRQLRSDTVKIKQLEEKLQGLRHEHEDYQQKVHAHFNTSATLFHSLTDSYREVYKHLATSAQSLCPDHISGQLALDGKDKDILQEETANSGQNELFDEPGEPEPPRDYADRKAPDTKGNLAEDFGLDKAEPEENKQENQ